MPGEPIRLGPFIGGINSLSDVSALSDVELLDCVNFELDLDGSLLSRPPITTFGAGIGGNKLRHLGFVYISGTVYHIASAGGNTSWSADGLSWTTITNLFGAAAMVQYNNRAWLINPSGAGGYWTPAGGYVAVATMPEGTAAVILKERMYIVGNTTNPSRVSWSALSDPTTWNSGTDFADVGSGDGQSLKDIIVFNDTLVIFKDDSTYTYPFDSGPSSGVIRRISSTIGATKRDCVVLYEQNLYVYHEGNVYEVVNYDFTRLNSKVPFIYDATAPSSFTDEVFLSIFGDRLIVRYYNRVYAFGFRTRTWTRWSTNKFFGPLRAAPVNTTAAINNPYYAGACISGDNSIFRLDDGFSSDRSESMTCSITTKNYDLSVSHKFKRLFWWGVDILTKTSVVGTVTPVVFSFQARWQDIQTLRWNQLYTWNRLTETSVGVTTTVPTVIGGGLRKFVKFMKSIRFRQVNFSVSTTTTGTTADAPVRLFSITAFIGQKQDVSQAVS